MYKNLTLRPISKIERFLLRFIKSEFSFENGIFYKYKKMFGHLYILEKTNYNV